jgi:hypothetical protein
MRKLVRLGFKKWRSSVLNRSQGLFYVINCVPGLSFRRENFHMTPAPNKHSCGYPIIRVLPRSIHTSELVVWYDGKNGSPTYKKVITRCPGCGEHLPTK